MYITPIQTGDILSKTANSIVDQFKEEADKHQKRAQLATSYATIAEQMGFDKNYVKTLSLEQRMGLVEGKKQQAALDHQQRTTDLQARRVALEEQQSYNAIEAMKQQREQVAYQQAQQQAQQAFYRDMARYAPAGQLSAPLSTDYELSQGQSAPNIMQMLQSASRSGYNVPPAVLDDLYRALNPVTKQNLFGPQDMGRVMPMLDPNGRPIPNMGLAPISSGNAQVIDLQGKEPRPDLSGAPEGPPLSKDSRFYWDEQSRSWKPLSLGNPLFDGLVQKLAEQAGMTNAVRPAAPAPAPPYKRFVRGADGKMVEAPASPSK